MKRLFIITNIALSCPVNSCYSQYFDMSDSLEQVITGEKDPCKSLYAKALLAENKLILRTGFWDSLIVEAQHCGDKKTESAALNNAGYLYSVEGKTDTALSYYEKSILLQSDAKDYSAMCNTINNIGNIYHLRGNLRKAIDCYSTSFGIYKKLGDKEGMANCLLNLGYIHQDHNDDKKSLENILLAEKYYREVNDQMGLGSALNNLGALYSKQKKYILSLQYYKQSLEVRTKINDLHGMANSYSNISLVYFHTDSLEKAFEFQEKALEIRKQISDKRGLATSFTFLSEFYHKAKNTSKALESGLLAWKNAQQTGFPDTMEDAAKALSNAFQLAGQYEQALFYHKEYVKMRDSMVNDENKRLLIQSEFEHKYANEKMAFEVENERQQMEIRQNNTKLNAQQTRLYVLIAGIVFLLAVSYVLYRNYIAKQKAYLMADKQKREVEKQKEEIERLSIVASETGNVVVIMDPDGKLEWVNESFEKLNAITLDELKQVKGETIFDVSNNPRIREIVAESIRTRKSFTYESFNSTRDGKKVWESSTLTPIFSESGELKKLVIIDTDITERKYAEEQVIQKNKDITDSINYAKRIQYALLQQDELLKKNLHDYFVLFKPKDIVSGDFYWATEAQLAVGSQQFKAEGLKLKVESSETENNPATFNLQHSIFNLEPSTFYLAVCDSTGHGVPGAFMSLLNISFLNEAVIEKKIHEPGEVFNYVRSRLVQSMEGRKDGMDAVLVKLEKMKLSYAAAYNNPVVVRNNQLMELPGDKIPVGKSDKSNTFKSYHFDCKNGDMIYLYTDGYSDQFGGGKKAAGKKFKEANLKKMFAAVAHHPVVRQKQMLEDNFESWKGDLEQIDDVLIIGFRM